MKKAILILVCCTMLVLTISCNANDNSVHQTDTSSQKEFAPVTSETSQLYPDPYSNLTKKHRYGEIKKVSYIYTLKNGMFIDICRICLHIIHCILMTTVLWLTVKQLQFRLYINMEKMTNQQSLHITSTEMTKTSNRTPLN